MTQPKKRGGCLKIGCGGLLGLVALSMVIGAIGGGSSTPAPPSTRVDTGYGVDHGELLVECERAVKARLNFPDEAEFVSAFSVGLNEEISNDVDSSTWASTVKAKNAFGVQSTMRFQCSKRQGDSAVSLTMYE